MRTYWIRAYCVAKAPISRDAANPAGHMPQPLLGSDLRSIMSLACVEKGIGALPPSVAVARPPVSALRGADVSACPIHCGGESTHEPGERRVMKSYAFAALWASIALLAWGPALHAHAADAAVAPGDSGAAA